MSVRTNSAQEHPLAERLRAYGCSEFIPLDEKLSKPEQLNYLDLLPKQSNHTPSLSAVAEHQGTALLYVIDASGDAKSDAPSLATVRKQLANRSDPAWLGVVRPGSLEIYPINFYEAADAQPVKVIEERSSTAPLFFQSLVHGTFENNDQLRGTDYVFRKIFDLLTQTTNEFVPQDGSGRLDALEVLSMAGRALFFRFLMDRRIVLPDELHGRDGICRTASELKDTFSSAEKAAQTSAWLDETFNGDFLPLINERIPASDRRDREAEYLKFYQRTEHLVGRKIFTHLEAILRGWRATGGAFQPELDWGDLDFAHIPVGVLSQVYESFSHRADPRTARDTSVHYTPRTIAALMVDEAFAPLKNKSSAKVLDPSCGAGIFLVLAFRRLFRERWQHDEDRPKTTSIQDILYNQVRGFDISESALRLAALGLYVTAIELNASPRPPQALKFPRNLRNEVLYCFGKQSQGDETITFPLGSLGPEVSPDFNGTFDIVIGNPPWTRLRDDKDEEDDEAKKGKRKSKTDELNKEFTAIGRHVLEARGLKDLAKRYENPDKNPDLPFLWRAMKWARDGGIIALAMHPRLFMRTSGKGYHVWQAVLKSVEVTGIMNGADLRKTAVWEGMDAPFCILFARNTKPSQGHRFHYSVPSYEPNLNDRGRFRIDYEAAQPISVARVERQPWLLKTLSLGTWLDIEVMESLKAYSGGVFGDLWRKFDPKKLKGGKGYSIGHKSAPFIGPMLDFVRPKGFEIEFAALRTFRENHGSSSAYRARTAAAYLPPLVIVPKAPGDDNEAPHAYFSDQPLAFSQSYYGYSCKDHEDEQTLASLIYLLAHSTLFRYFALMISVSQGVDYMIFTKRDFDALPFPELKPLSAEKKTTIRNLAHRLQHDTQKPWDEINRFIFSLYGLGADAVQVTTDTLFAAASYRKAGKSALDRTRHDTRVPFVGGLSDALEPYFEICDEHVAVREANFQPDDWREPWFFLTISRVGETLSVSPTLMRKAMEVANRQGTSRIIIHAPGKRGLLLGLLNQRRWWTPTRARLCAQHIIRQHLGAFGLPEHA